MLQRQEDRDTSTYRSTIVMIGATRAAALAAAATSDPNLRPRFFVFHDGAFVSSFTSVIEVDFGAASRGAGLAMLVVEASFPCSGTRLILGSLPMPSNSC